MPYFGTAERRGRVWNVFSDFWPCNQQEKTCSGVCLSGGLLYCCRGFVHSEISTLKGVFCKSCKLFIRPLVEGEESGRETGAVLSAKIVISLLLYNNTCLDTLI